MKIRNIYLLLATTAVLLTGTSCVREEKDLFEDSAAVRMTKAIASYKEALTSSPNGWVMDYYPSNGGLGGYQYTAVFNTDGEVSMRAPVSITSSMGIVIKQAGDETVSDYDVISEQGPVLTFDTYNTPFHIWSDPSASSPGGYNADYEFIFERATADTLFLHGKKHGMKLLMYRLDEDPKAYMGKMLDMTSAVSAAIHGRVISDGVSYIASFTDKQFTVHVTTDSTVSQPYSYTDKGIRLYQDLNIGGVKLRDLYYDKEQDTFSSPDGRVLSPVPTAPELFARTPYPWYFIFDGYGDDMAPYSSEMDEETGRILHGVSVPTKDYQNCVLWAASVGRTDSNILYYYSEPDYSIGFRPIISDGTPPLTTKLVDYDRCYDVACPIIIDINSIDDSTVSISPSSQDDFQWRGTGYFEGLYGPFVQHIYDGSPYKVTFNSKSDPTKVTLSSVGSDTWFTLQRWDI